MLLISLLKIFMTHLLIIVMERHNAARLSANDCDDRRREVDGRGHDYCPAQPVEPSGRQETFQAAHGLVSQDLFAHFSLPSRAKTS